MPRGIPNKNKKALKRGRKSKEELLPQKYEELQKEFQKLNEHSTRTINDLYHRIDNERSIQNEFRATIHNLNVVISTLGDRLFQLQRQNSSIIENRNQFATSTVAAKRSEEY